MTWHFKDIRLWMEDGRHTLFNLLSLIPAHLPFIHLAFISFSSHSAGLKFLFHPINILLDYVTTYRMIITIKLFKPCLIRCARVCLCVKTNSRTELKPAISINIFRFSSLLILFLSFVLSSFYSLFVSDIRHHFLPRCVRVC